MFQNISVPQLIKDLEDTLFDKEYVDCFDQLTPTQVFESIKLILENSSFRMNSDKHFKLKHGIMTGSPLSVSLANIRLSKIEKTIIINNPNVLFYRRYVDDLVFVAKRSNLEKLESQFNTF